MILAALEIEVEEYQRQHRDARDRRGYALVVRNGQARPRRLTVGTGTITLRAPRVNDRRRVDGVRQRFTSQILPPLSAPLASAQRRVAAVVSPWPLDRGLPRGAASAARRRRGGALAHRDHAPDGHLADQWRRRSLADRDFISIWVDGVHFNIRLEDDRLAALVVVGARPDGTKEVIAIEDGYRESTESWLTVLRDLKTRGMRAPALAIGDGALGSWAAVREVWPEAREQRC
jgi:putative transposase